MKELIEFLTWLVTQKKIVVRRFPGGSSKFEYSLEDK